MLLHTYLEGLEHAASDIALHVIATGVASADEVHDFRVALRRSRALAGGFKRLFPRRTLAHSRSFLRASALAACRLRDLDVLLQRLDDYNSLAVLDASELAVLRASLTAQRGEQLDVFKACLRSPAFAADMKIWRRLLTTADTVPRQERNSDLADMTRRRSCKLARRLLRALRAMTPASGPQQLHALRIAGKKFRYTVEFRQLLEESVDLGAIIGSVRKLQDLAGVCQDLHVHMGLLAPPPDRGENTSGIPLAAARDRLAAAVARCLMVSRADLFAYRHEFLAKKNRQDFLAPLCRR